MRVYLDTNTLIKEGWPRVSVKLREMLALSRASQITVVMPEAVEREMKAHWFRELETRLTELTNIESKFADTMDQIEEDRGQMAGDLFDENSARNKYAEIVEKLKSEWGIISAPLTSVPLDTLF